jgi:phosphoribosylanthranilate isomerase
MNGEIKICGITRIEDAAVAIDAGADYLGFVFYAGSKRAVIPSVVQGILAALPAGVRGIGVFVNESPATIERMVTECGLYAVQLHGDETSNDFIGRNFRIWRAVRWEVGGWKPDPVDWLAERWLVDAAVPGVYGGTGQTADWAAAADLAAQRPCLLAGGLTVETVAEAIRRVHPAGVDVSGGVESGPGCKDASKIRSFIKAARAAWKRIRK